MGLEVSPVIVLDGVLSLEGNPNGTHFPARIIDLHVGDAADAFVQLMEVATLQLGPCNDRGKSV